MEEEGSQALQRVAVRDPGVCSVIQEETASVLSLEGAQSVQPSGSDVQGEVSEQASSRSDKLGEVNEHTEKEHTKVQTQVENAGQRAFVHSETLGSDKQGEVNERAHDKDASVQSHDTNTGEGEVIHVKEVSEKSHEENNSKPTANNSAVHIAENETSLHKENGVVPNDKCEGVDELKKGASEQSLDEGAGVDPTDGDRSRLDVCGIKDDELGSLEASVKREQTSEGENEPSVTDNSSEGRVTHEDVDMEHVQVSVVDDSLYSVVETASEPCDAAGIGMNCQACGVIDEGNTDGELTAKVKCDETVSNDAFNDRVKESEFNKGNCVLETVSNNEMDAPSFANADQNGLSNFDVSDSSEHLQNCGSSNNDSIKSVDD